MIIVWDEPKRVRNLQTHGLDFIDARDRFDFADALVEPSYSDRRGGLRYKAIGPLDGSLVFLAFALLGTEAISLISLRAASRKERNTYVSRQASFPRTFG